MQDPRAPSADRRRVPPGLDAVARRLAADEPHVRVVEEGVEDADRVRAAADAGDDGVGKALRGRASARAPPPR